MPRSKNKPGTERYRDERRPGGPRMHGAQWHDEEPPASDSDAVAAETATDVESAPETEGMGKGRATGTSKRHAGTQSTRRAKRRARPGSTRG